MANLPHFSDGKFGKLTPEVLNTLIEKVERIDNLLNQPPPDLSRQRGASSQFPMPAQLTGVLHMGDQSGGETEGLASTIVGYKWNSLVWSGTRWDLGSYRYLDADEIEEGQKTTPAIMIGGNTNNMTELLVNSFVVLHPFNDAMGGSFLGFQQPIGQGSFVGRIELGGGQCTLPDDGMYQVRIQRINEEGVLEDSDETIAAMNGTEIERNGYLGGIITGSSCDTSAVPTSIPIDTFVICQRVSQDLAIFSLANDLCVSCSCESVATETSIAEVNESIDQYRDQSNAQSTTTIERNNKFSGSIVGEMNK
jgi:hypothetical protein